MTHKIMVVDDNSVTRRMVRNALQRNGHDVIEAADGATARALMKSEHPRVVLQDLMLPDADGFELVGEAKRRQDLIRWGEYTSRAWLFKASTAPYRILLPIPQAQIEINPLLQQNPGY